MLITSFKPLYYYKQIKEFKLNQTKCSKHFSTLPLRINLHEMCTIAGCIANSKRISLIASLTGDDSFDSGYAFISARSLICQLINRQLEIRMPFHSSRIWKNPDIY